MPTSNLKSNSVLIVAAEASSSLYAQRLLEHWQAEGQAVQAFGVGSRAMEKLKFEIIGRSESMAVVGLQEVVAHWSEIKSVFDTLLVEAEKRKPKFALLLDYPDFNLRLAKKLKKLGIPVVYYISPQIWAWRQSRVHLIRKVVDKMLVLFPFEEGFYQRHNVPVEFVGHPLLDELSDRFFDPEYLAERRQRYGISKYDKVLGLMPGSRNSEIGHHLETQIEAAKQLVNQVPHLKVALLLAPSFDYESFKAKLPRLDFPMIVIQDEPMEMVHVVDTVLCASGTATLLVGLMEKPMVIMYKMNALTAVLAKFFVKSVKYFGMINLVLDKEVAPEFFQEKATPRNLANALAETLKDDDKNHEVVSQLKLAKTRLGDKGATDRVAKALEGYWG